jgi:hypothetical protein
MRTQDFRRRATEAGMGTATGRGAGTGRGNRTGTGEGTGRGSRIGIVLISRIVDNFANNLSADRQHGNAISKQRGRQKRKALNGEHDGEQKISWTTRKHRKRKSRNRNRMLFALVPSASVHRNLLLDVF